MNKAVAGQQRANHGQGYNLPSSYPPLTPYSALSLPLSLTVSHSQQLYLDVACTERRRLAYTTTFWLFNAGCNTRATCRLVAHTHTPRAGSRKHLIYAGNAFVFLVTAKDGQQDGQNRITVISAYRVLSVLSAPTTSLESSLCSDLVADLNFRFN